MRSFAEEVNNELGMEIFTDDDMVSLDSTMDGAFATSHPRFTYHTNFTTNLSSSAKIPLGAAVLIRSVTYDDENDDRWEDWLVKQIIDDSGEEEWQWNKKAIEKMKSHEELRKVTGGELRGLFDL